MAATHYSPLPEQIEDPVTYQEAAALFARTGHDAPVSTLRRWAKEDRLETVKSGRTVYVSWSDLLEAHAKRMAVKLRASSNWP
ncbi:DNA-binding protein [Streptomyces sp. NBRC 110035]|uniref:DNA-binding protein n=1 Tax=Streptomyces sp. NBRC 110035 TaxID=1547867 RepID=UPI0005A9D8BF|nr:DNA-binding protein [Streptomyces sp. NBRC 110035]